MPARYRPDHDGSHRRAFDRNKKIIYATQTVCGICGKPVDFSVKYPNPLSPCIDHIIPIDKGGHPSDIDNLQLAHWSCNRQKSDKIQLQTSAAQSAAQSTAPPGAGAITPTPPRPTPRGGAEEDDLKWTIDWTKYRSQGTTPA